MSTSEAMTFRQCSKSTTKKYFSYFHRMVSYYVQSEYNQLTLCQFSPEIAQRDDRGIGVDESIFTHLNTIEDKHKSQVWILGLIERHANQFITIVIGNAQEMTTEGILPIFQRCIFYKEQAIRTFKKITLKGLELGHSPLRGSKVCDLSLKELVSQIEEQTLVQFRKFKWKLMFVLGELGQKTTQSLNYYFLSRYFNETGSNFSD